MMSPLPSPTRHQSRSSAQSPSISMSIDAALFRPHTNTITTPHSSINFSSNSTINSCPNSASITPSHLPLSLPLISGSTCTNPSSILAIPASLSVALGVLPAFRMASQPLSPPVSIQSQSPPPPLSSSSTSSLSRGFYPSLLDTIPRLSSSSNLNPNRPAAHPPMYNAMSYPPTSYFDSNDGYPPQQSSRPDLAPPQPSSSMHAPAQMHTSSYPSAPATTLPYSSLSFQMESVPPPHSHLVSNLVYSSSPLPTPSTVASSFRHYSGSVPVSPYSFSDGSSSHYGSSHYSHPQQYQHYLPPSVSSSSSHFDSSAIHRTSPPNSNPSSPMGMNASLLKDPSLPPPPPVSFHLSGASSMSSMPIVPPFSPSSPVPPSLAHKRSAHSQPPRSIRNHGQTHPDAIVYCDPATQQPLLKTEASDSQPPGESTPARPFKCVACPKTFIRKQDLKRHSLIHDPNSAGFKCSHCGTGFTRSDALYRHTKTRRCLKD